MKNFAFAMAGDEENSGSTETASNIDSSHVLYMHLGEPSNFKLATKLLNGENFSHWKRSAEVTLSP